MDAFNTQPRFITIAEKKLMGIKVAMSVLHDLTSNIWQPFMQQKAAIKNRLNNELISLKIYPTDYFLKFNAAVTFEKWAAVEVCDFNFVPQGMSTFVLRGELYAVFHYKGAATDTRIFHYIFETWLPRSGYIIDNRPHFEILGSLYKNNDPASEEDIYIPIKPA